MVLTSCTDGVGATHARAEAYAQFAFIAGEAGAEAGEGVVGAVAFFLRAQAVADDEDRVVPISAQLFDKPG